MKKIVHLTSVHQPFDTRICLRECRSLARQGYEVVLVAPHSQEEVVDGVRVRPVPKPRNRLWRMLVTTLQVAHAAVQEDADLYHLHDPELLPLGRWLRWRGRQVVYDMHEDLPKSFVIKSWIPPWLRRWAAVFSRALEPYLLGNLPIVFAETSYREDYPWVRKYEIVLNTPVVEEIPHSQQQHARPSVGYIGRVSPDRGSQRMIEALALLKQSGCQVDFDCVGPVHPPHEQKLLALTSQAGLEGVRFHGLLPPRQGFAVVARCHVGLAVLRMTPNAVGSYPTKMFEYMAMGLPVVVSDVPLYREVIESADCGFCVDPESPQAMADAIGWLVSNPDQAAQMGQRGRQAVFDRYSWEPESRKLFRFYQDLLPRPDSGRSRQSAIAGESSPASDSKAA